MIALIAACAQNRTIGDKGKIPWNIKGEQKRFRELTTNNVTIMVRRTYEEIGRPLPGRFTIVVPGTKSDETVEESYGMLYTAEISAFEDQLHHEIGQVLLKKELPADWTYPFIQPKLLELVRENKLINF